MLCEILFAAVALTVSQNEGAAALQDQRDALERRTLSSHVEFSAAEAAGRT
jgi:hypothetical protein